MLRSIYREILDASRPTGTGKAPRRARPRRLAVESLESRKLMTAATLTLNSISDGSFEAPALAADDLPSRPRQFALAVPGRRAALAPMAAASPSAIPMPLTEIQVAFLKNNASMSQTVYLDAGVYGLSFLAAQRVIPTTSPRTRKSRSWIDYNTPNVEHRHDRSRKHQLCRIPNVEFHGNGGHHNVDSSG